MWCSEWKQSALQSSPWGLMQALEQQVGELRVDADDPGAYDGAPGDASDSRPSSGFFEPSEGQSPRGRSEPTETSPVWAPSSDRPKSVGELLNGEPVLHGTLPRSFSVPYPPLEGIAEEGAPVDSWQWEQAWQQHHHQQQQQQQQQQPPPAELRLSEEDYQQVVRVEGYILSLIQRHMLAPRPCQPRTSLHPEPAAYACPAPPGHGPAHRRTPSLSAEQRAPESHVLPQLDLPPNPQSLGWGRDLLEGGAPPLPLEEDCYLALAYAPPRPHSLTERLSSPPLPLEAPQPLPPVLPPPPCSSSASPSQHYFLPLPPPPPPHGKHSLVSAQYVPVQGCHAPVRSPRHYNAEQPKHGRTPASPDHPPTKSRGSKRNHGHERQRAKRSGGGSGGSGGGGGGGGGRAGRSQSENSLLGQRVLPERRYSTTERHQGRADPGQNQGPTAGQHPAHGEGRRWCSNLELSQDEGEAPAGPAHRRPHRKARHAHSCSQNQTQNYYQHHHHHHHHQNHQQQQQQHGQRRHPDYQLRAPLCQEEEGYGGGGGGGGCGAAAAESESSMSEVYSPASSSLSSDSDESGGLVWPQQLPPRLVSTSSSSSPSPQTASAASAASSSSASASASASAAAAGAATAHNPAQPKAFVKIKASHALKKKILRFRSGSLKVMTTV
ncbi:uncharacterized protein dact3b isoform X2 [Nelusetta ayraudi]|uniref:uncharacterized protein dact3b isoform X2 n=1 Tax=Nelusetta ayraudi TaxID=303726 RepID=UPI003F6F34B3